MGVKGVDNIKKLFKNKGTELTRESIKIVKSSAIVGRNVAILNAPNAFGKLRQGINFKATGTNAKVFSQMPYSVYVEFGTGKKVKIPSYTPKPLLEAARKMRGKGKGNFDDFLKSLSRWARLKGIPQEAVYPIAMSILRDGVEAKPFMRPAFVASRKKMLIELKKL